MIVIRSHQRRRPPLSFFFSAGRTFLVVLFACLVLSLLSISFVASQNPTCGVPILNRDNPQSDLIFSTNALPQSVSSCHIVVRNSNFRSLIVRKALPIASVQIVNCTFLRGLRLELHNTNATALGQLANSTITVSNVTILSTLYVTLKPRTATFISLEKIVCDFAETPSFDLTGSPTSDVGSCILIGSDDGNSPSPSTPPLVSVTIADSNLTVRTAGYAVHFKELLACIVSLQILRNSIYRHSSPDSSNGGVHIAEKANTQDQDTCQGRTVRIGTCEMSSLSIRDNNITSIQGRCARASVVRVGSIDGLDSVVVVRNHLTLISEGLSAPEGLGDYEEDNAIRVHDLGIHSKAAIHFSHNRIVMSGDMSTKPIALSYVRCGGAGRNAAWGSATEEFSADCTLTVDNNTCVADMTSSVGKINLLHVRFLNIGASIDPLGWNVIGLSLSVTNNVLSVARPSRTLVFKCPAFSEAELFRWAMEFLVVALVSLHSVSAASLISVRNNTFTATGMRLDHLQRGGIYFFQTDPAGIAQSVNRIVIADNRFRVTDSLGGAGFTAIFSNTLAPILSLEIVRNTIDIQHAIILTSTAIAIPQYNTALQPCRLIWGKLPQSAKEGSITALLLLRGAARKLTVSGNTLLASEQGTPDALVMFVFMMNTAIESDVDIAEVTENIWTVRRFPALLALAGRPGAVGTEYLGLVLGPRRPVSKQIGKQSFSFINVSGNNVHVESGGGFRLVSLNGNVLLESAAVIICNNNNVSVAVSAGASSAIYDFTVDAPLASIARFVDYIEAVPRAGESRSPRIVVSLVRLINGSIFQKSSGSSSSSNQLAPSIELRGNTLSVTANSTISTARSSTATAFVAEAAIAVFETYSDSSGIEYSEYSRLLSVTAESNTLTLGSSSSSGSNNNKLVVGTTSVISTQSTATGLVTMKDNRILRLASFTSSTTSLLAYRHSAATSRSGAIASSVKIVADRNVVDCSDSCARSGFVAFNYTSEQDALAQQKFHLTFTRNRFDGKGAAAASAAVVAGFAPILFPRGGADVRIYEGESDSSDDGGITRFSVELHASSAAGNQQSCNRLLSRPLGGNFFSQKNIARSWMTVDVTGCDPTSTPSLSATATHEISQSVALPAPYVVPEFAVLSSKLQGTNAIASVVVAAVVPTLGFAVARQQAMVGLVQRAKTGNCAGIDEEAGVDAASSPTQVQIGTSVGRFFVGAAVMNTVLVMCLVLLAQAVGTLYLKVTHSSSWQKPMHVFARCHVAMVLYVTTSILMSPSLTMALVVLTVKDVATGHKVLAAVFALLLAAATVYHAMWALLVRERKEKYKKMIASATEVSERSPLRRFLVYWFEGPGEWVMPSGGSNQCSDKQHLQFDAALPQFEGYSDRAFWFSLPEVGVQVALAVAALITQLVPENKSCVTDAVMQTVILGGYCFLCVWKRPFQELFLRIMVPVITVVQMVILVAVAAMVHSGLPMWIDSLVIFVASLQSFMVLFTLLCALQPLAASALKAWRRFKSRIASRPQSSRPKTWTLRDLLRDRQHTNNNSGGYSNRGRETSNSRNQNHSRHHRSSNNDDDDDNAVELVPQRRQQQERGTSHNNRPSSGSNSRREESNSDRRRAPAAAAVTSNYRRNDGERRRDGRHHTIDAPDRRSSPTANRESDNNPRYPQQRQQHRERSSTALTGDCNTPAAAAARSTAVRPASSRRRFDEI